MIETNKIYCGDSLSILKTLPDNSVSCVMTSPPYWGLRDYGVSGQLGLEKTPDEYIDKLIAIFNEVKRVLRKDGTCWVNLGDTYGGGSGEYNKHDDELGASKAYIKRKSNGMPKCLCMIPERFAMAMIDNGWILRNKIIWYKRNHMPSSVKDRFSNSWEYIYVFTKSKKYYFDLDAVREEYITDENKPGGMERDRIYDYNSKTKILTNRKGKNPKDYDRFKLAGFGNVPGHILGKNPGDHWDIITRGFPEAHFAVYPEELCIKPIKAGCRKDDIVLDPFSGAGTTCLVARKLQRRYIGIELNPEYVKMSEKRIWNEAGLL
jgi:site-specific DNA-methyltransferase (cytosine-N4-specific)